MPIINNLKAQQLGLLKRRTRQLETQSPLSHAAVSRGALRVRSVEGFLVEGSALVDGILTVSGVLDGDGTLNWDGPASFSGTTIIGGSLQVNGTAFAVTVAIVDMSTAAVFVNTLNSAGLAALASLQVNGNALVSGILTNSGYSSTSSPVNVFMDSGGRFYRLTSASRFKIDPQPMELPAALLDVPVEAWIDRSSAERYADLLQMPRPYTREQQDELDSISFRRVPGVIAEKVAAAGGEAFVGYTPEGEIESVYYDRFTLARTAILADKVRALEEKIERLERMQREG